MTTRTKPAAKSNIPRHPVGTNHFQFRSHQFVRWGGVLTGDVSGFIDFLPYRGRRRFGRWCRGFFLSPGKGDGDHDERGGGKEGYLHLSVPFRFGVTQTPARVSRPDRFTRGRLQGEDRPYFATSYSVKADLALAQVAARNVRCQTPASARVLGQLTPETRWPPTCYLPLDAGCKIFPSGICAHQRFES